MKGTRLFDGENLVEIVMNNLVPGQGYTPDWSNDFYSVGALKYNDDMEAYEVEEVNYCIDQANDWKNAEGDFVEDEPDREEIENRNVDVTWYELPPKTKDGKLAVNGLKITDSTGIYEVMDTGLTGCGLTVVSEIFFDDDGNYEYGEDRKLTRDEVKRMTSM